MKILEWILNVIFSIASLWDRSRDEFVDEHRAYERRILVYTVMAIVFLIASILVYPTIEMLPKDGFKYVTYTVYKNIGLIVLVIGAFSFIASLCNMAGLLYFRYKYGISD